MDIKKELIELNKTKEIIEQKVVSIQQNIANLQQELVNHNKNYLILLGKIEILEQLENENG